MLSYDPIPWLMAQDGLPAVRARRILGLTRDGDDEEVRAVARRSARSQRADGSFEGSLMKTAGVLNLLNDLRADADKKLIAAASSYLFSVLQSQPGCGRARSLKPGGLTAPCDLCGFFGPYEDRAKPEVLAHGAREMNFFREYEPLVGPGTRVRSQRRSTLDRAGPGSCYEWGLIPLCYALEALYRAGYADDRRIQPATNVLLGAQRQSGGWCRNLGGHPSCSVHAIRALGSHHKLRKGKSAQRALELVHAVQRGAKGQGAKRALSGNRLFAFIQAIASFNLPIARDVLRDALEALAPKQRKNGTFGTPCTVERVVAVLVATRRLERSPSRDR